VSEPGLVPPGEGEIIGDAAHRRVDLLSDHETLHATWSRFGPHTVGADLHVHHRHIDLFYVLAGELTVGLGIQDEGVVVPARTLARVPPLVVHGFRNTSEADVRYLNFHAPGQGFADFLRGMRDGRTVSYDQYPPPADGGRPTTDAVIGRNGFVACLPGLRVVLLADVEEIGIAEAQSEPGGPSPPPHLHRRHVESFYVLEGVMRVTGGGRELRAAAGSWVQVPPGVPHTFAFPDHRPVRFLDVHTPSGGYGAFLHALHDARDDEPAAARATFDQEPA
jgi:mannose-6-phosphate isomerase-like protein (cupin superfamily)